MNEQKLKQLLAAARQETAPLPPAEFAADVLRAVRADTPPSAGVSTLWDHLNGLFPRLAIASVAVILLCAAADWSLTSADQPGAGDGMEQMTSPFVFPEEL